MKPQELKQEYIRLRAEGKSYSFIADELHISKSTCTQWEVQLSEEIAKLKKEKLKKEARIKQLGDTLEKVNNALENIDFTNVAPEKLLDYKLKYTEALQKEYIGLSPAFKLNGSTSPKDIMKALSDLLDRVRAGEVTPEQANRECLILCNLLKAFETIEVKAKLEQLENIIGSR